LQKKYEEEKRFPLLPSLSRDEHATEIMSGIRTLINYTKREKVVRKSISYAM
jgi:hypothetical protein